MSEQDKQPTQPRGKDSKGEPAEPIEIPVPKRETIDALIRQAARRSPERQRPSDRA